MPLLKILLFFCVFYSSSILCAQTNLDSLYTLLPTSEGSQKVDLLNTIAWQLKFSDPDQALDLCNKSILLSNTIKYTQGEAKAMYQLAAFHYLKGDLNTSLAISKKSIALFKSIDNSFGQARNWMLTGMNWGRLKDYTEAIKYYEKALATCQLFEYDDLLRKVQTNMANVSFARGDYKRALDEYSTLASSWLEKGDSSNYYIVLYNIAKSQQELGKYPEALSNFFEIQSFEKSINRTLYLANNYNDIGTLYLKLGLYEPTLEVFEMAKQLYQEIDNQRKIGIVNINFGILFFDNKEFEKAIFHYERALHIHDSLGLDNTGKIYNNLAALKIETNKFDEALSLLDQSIQRNLDIGNQRGLVSNYSNMANAYFGLEQKLKSEQYYKKALEISTEIGDLFEKQKASEGLATLCKIMNKNEAAEFYSSIAQATNDSLFNKQKLLEVNKLLVTNLYKEHKNKTKKLNKKLSATREQLILAQSNKNSFFSRYKMFFISFFALSIIGGILLFKKYHKTSRLNRTLKNKATADQEKFETAFESKNKELALLSLETAQQTDLLKKIHASLQQIISKTPENQDIKKLEKILSTHSIDQNNWENFNSYFNKVYVGFFDRLSTSFPSITNKELRLCALIRLRIPIYETSIILGISPRSVHKSRYRIRKKMELDPEANIDEFICTI